MAMLVGSLLGSAVPLVAQAQSLSNADKKQMEELIKNYILENPEVMIESLQRYQQKQREVAEQDAQKAVADHIDSLERSPRSPVAGNPNGDVTIVEFFDYHCGYCKKVFPAVQELLKSDKDVRYVFKDLPILGPESRLAAEFSLAVWKVDPSKYLAFHTALMTGRGDLSERHLIDVAKGLGIDVDSVKVERSLPGISAQLDENVELARQLGINGTPAFIVGGKLIPGAVDLATLRELVSKARAS